MLVTTKFDAKRDIRETEQFGYVNLADAYVNGSLPSTISSDSSSYNDIEDPSSILGKPSDTFEALEMAKNLHKVVNNERQSTAKAEGGN